MTEPAKKMMLIATAASASLAIAIMATKSYRVFSSATSVGSEYLFMNEFSFTNAKYTLPELIATSLLRGFVTSLLVVPIYLLAIFVCFVIWFAGRKPHSN